MAYLEELLPELRKGAKIRAVHWDKKMYFQYKDGNLIDHNNDIRDGFSLDKALSFDWELYKEPIDWDYIIKNKCLCWFWDNKGDEKQIGYLVGVNDNRFYLEAPEDCFNSYTYCCPVRRDELTFYEEK